MERRLAWRPQRTDGRLIRDNLWNEADLSRATMNRAARILAEWNTRVAACGAFTSGEARKNSELTTLQAKLANKTRECTELHHQLDAAATAIAALHHDNTCYVKNSTNAADSSSCKLTAEGSFKSAAANARDRPRLSQTPVSPAVQQPNGLWDTVGTRQQTRAPPAFQAATIPRRPARTNAR